MKQGCQLLSCNVRSYSVVSLMTSSSASSNINRVIRTETRRGQVGHSQYMSGQKMIKINTKKKEFLFGGGRGGERSSVACLGRRKP